MLSETFKELILFFVVVLFIDEVHPYLSTPAARFSKIKNKDALNCLCALVECTSWLVCHAKNWSMGFK